MTIAELLDNLDGWGIIITSDFIIKDRLEQLGLTPETEVTPEKDEQNA